MTSIAAVISRDRLSRLLSAIKHHSRRDAVYQLREAVAVSYPWENDNRGDRQTIEIDLADGAVCGFTVKFDGVGVFQYIGPDTAIKLPTLSMTPLRQRDRHGGWREEFQLALGTSFWSIIYHGVNGGVPFVMQHMPQGTLT
jgi:hypothetical protein